MADMDSFANRVDKVFGSLGSGAGFSSPWQISREQQQSKPYKPRPEDDDDEGGDEEDDQENGQQQRCASGFSGEFRFRGNADRMDMEEDPEEEGREIRGMVGLDPTLDFEDEEDEFDRTAVGREGDSDRIYMNEIIKGDKKAVSSKNALPVSLYDLKKSARDPRANHMAAKARLQEDAKQVAAYANANVNEAMEPQNAKSIHNESGAETQMEETETLSGSKRGSSSGLTSVKKTEDKEFETKQDMLCGDFVENEQNSENKENMTCGNLVENEQNALTPPRSTLDEAASYSSTIANGTVKSHTSKRVRFQLDEKPRDPNKPEFVRPKVGSPHASQVPDHVRNPSKYTRYTLDWSVEDSVSQNLEALRACQEITRANTDEQASTENKSEEKIVFIPRGERNVNKDQNASAGAGDMNMNDNDVNSGQNTNTSSIAEDMNKKDGSENDTQLIRRNTMCVDDLDGGNAGDVTDVDMGVKVEEVPDIDKCLVNKMGKGGRKYRAKKDTETEMDVAE